MKEEVTEYDTVEKTQELIYCDLCGSECTEEHDIVPGHRCRDCPEGEDSFSSFEELQEEMDLRFDEEERMGFLIMFAAVIFFPMILWGALEEWPKEGAKFVILSLFGTCLWGGCLLALWLL